MRIRLPVSSRLAVRLGVAGLVALLGGCTAGPGEELREPGQAVVQGSEGPPVAPGTAQWEMRAPIDTPRDDFATAVVGHEIWTFGGMTGSRGTRLQTTEVYDTRSNSWRYGPKLSEGLCSFEGVAIGPRIYLFGGLDEQADPTDFAAVLDTRTGTWRDLPPLPHARYAHDVQLVGGRIYVLGGEDGEGPQSAVDVYDPSSGTWSQAAPMPAARSSVDVTEVGGRLYVLGGWLGSGPTDKVQVYDPRRDVWRHSTPMPRPMSRGGAAAVGDRIYVSYHAWSYVYDVARGRWSRADPMTVPRHGLGYVAVGQRVYGIGGCTEHPLRDVSYVDVLDTSTA